MMPSKPIDIVIKYYNYYKSGIISKTSLELALAKYPNNKNTKKIQRELRISDKIHNIQSELDIDS